MALDFKQVDADLVPFRRRLLFVFFLVIVLFCVLIGRFAWLQIINKNAYTERAEKNRTVTVVSQAARGLIYDRNGELLAKNTLAYSLEITPDKVSDLEKTIDALSEIIPITTADRRRFVRLREDLNRYDSIPIRQELTDEEVAVFTGQQWRFPGVEINQREYRVYPEGSVGSHILGYIGSLSQSDKKRLTSEGLIDDYEGERVIGKVGIERSYESLLHGTPGHETLEITAGGHAVRSLAFEPPKAGKNLHLTIDMNLQRVAENAMKGKVGAVIAIQPKTGEILSFVSMPTYDPNLFPGGIDPKSWSQLNTAETKPLLNRAMRGLYPIGSTYKPFVALAGLETGATTADFVLDDTGVFTLGKHRFRDMSGVPKGRLDLRKSIAVSSDVYYYWLATRLGVDTIHDFMVPWGFGQKTGIDLVGEQTGVLPSREWKEARVKQPWMVGDTPSIGIGQGYNAFTLSAARARHVHAGQQGHRNDAPSRQEDHGSVDQQGRGRSRRTRRRHSAQVQKRGDRDRRHDRRLDQRHGPLRLQGRALHGRLQDGHRPGRHHRPGRQVRRQEAREEAPRPRALHRVRACTQSAHRACRSC